MSFCPTRSVVGHLDSAPDSVPAFAVAVAADVSRRPMSHQTIRRLMILVAALAVVASSPVPRFVFAEFGLEQ